ncbi:zinc-dependent metalloprotease family protein [Neptunicella marina]|uniref:Metallo-peptidase family M12B Reprolysin-like n=1 Tax=Neptunicella marina TaxID=2125989 RepID=A0A8J6M6J2_9ALTE|nr:zinc-dependent metalloprotease family protein [Neptunicella marina]MBC3767166.1 hypothetical protein [Neptunicella marina]
MRYICALLLCISSVTLAKQPLFSIKPSVSTTQNNNSGAVTVRLDPFWIDSGKTQLAKSLTIELADQLLQVTRDKYFKNSKGQWIWLGHIATKPHSYVGIVVGESLSATVSFDDKLYQLTQDSNEHYVLSDNSRFTQLDIDSAPQNVAQKAARDTVLSTKVNQLEITPSQVDIGFTDQQIIRLLVYYPSDALIDRPNVTDLIELDVARANQVFENNNLALRLEVTAMLALDIADTDNILSKMQSRTGPFTHMERVREKYQADLVHFYSPDIITIGGSRAYCGYANYAAFPGGSASSQSGVGVTSLQCAGGLTFAHEIGHNLGARHDRFEQNGGDPTYANYGYVNLDAGVRTVMSYNDACSDAGVSCQQIDYFSTPDLQPEGNIIGIAQHTADSADNSSMLALSANTLANFSGPTQPKGFVVSNGLQHSIDIRWDAYPGADAYLLTRLTALRESDGSARCIPGFVSVMQTFEVKGTQYQDTDVTSAQHYCYWLQAKNSKLLQGAQTSPDTFADTGYITDGKGALIGKIADIQLKASEQANIIIPVDANTDIKTLSVAVEQQSFEGSLSTEFTRSGDDIILKINNLQNQSGNARLMVSTGDYSEVFTVSYFTSHQQLPQFEAIQDYSIEQDQPFTLTLSLSYWDSSYLTPLRVYSDNYDIVRPEQMQLTDLGDGQYSLKIERDTIQAGTAKITLVTGNSEQDVSTSFMLTYERERYRAPIVRDMQFTLGDDGKVFRKLPLFDPDNDRLEVVITAQPQHGQLDLLKGADFEYIADRSFETSDSFSFYAVDPFDGNSNEVTVTINADDNTLSKRVAPRQKILASAGNVMLLTHEGNVWSWGKNEVNTAGRGRNSIADWQPVKTELSAIADIGTSEVTYYIKQDGTLWYMGQYHDGSEWHYVDKLLRVGDAHDWQSIECHNNQCWLIRQDGSLWQMDTLVSRDENAAGLQHFFTQANALYGWQQLSLNQNGGLLSNDKNEVWSFALNGAQPPGRERDIAELAKLDVPTLAASVQLTHNGGLVMYHNMTYGWGEGLYYFNGETAQQNLPHLIDTATWQSVSSDISGFAAVIEGSLYSWAYSDMPFNALYAHLARGEAPDLYRDRVGDYNDWLSVFMPTSDIMFALRADGSLWSAGAEFNGFIILEDDRPRSGWQASPLLGLGKIDDIVWNPRQISALSAKELGTDDTDSDGVRDYLDSDDDSDGISDVADAHPYDTDNDGIDNAEDPDDDNDGVTDASDPAPLDATITGRNPVPPPTVSGGGSMDLGIMLALMLLTMTRVARCGKRVSSSHDCY